MSLYNTTHGAMPHESSFFIGWDDLMRYLDVLRLIAWLLRWLRATLPKWQKPAEKVPPYTAPSLSTNEFGYVDWNGAY
jgi:hypothetical protein